MGDNIINSRRQFAAYVFSDPSEIESYQPIKRIEKWVVAVFLVGVFAGQLAVSLHLHALQAFDQYNLFFDADSNQYVSAVAHGWSFNRVIHPGFGLLFNVPTRALDLLASGAGLFKPGAVRAFVPILLPALCGAIGGAFWWRASCVLDWSPLARIGALLLMQGSFSQMLFTAIPECYPVSGALYCVLLWAAARAHRDGSLLERRSVQAMWLLLSVISTGVTVTNGAVWVAVWLALRWRLTPWRRWLAEGCFGGVVVVLSIPAIAELDRWAYKLEPISLTLVFSQVSGHGLNSVFEPTSVLSRTIELPAHALASVLSPQVQRIRNELAEKNANRYHFGFSFIETAITLPRILISWAIVVIGLASISRLAWSPMARTCASVLAFNAALHATWGLEVFLYSQHWLAILVFAVSAGMQRAGVWGVRLLWLVAIGVATHNTIQFSEMVSTLQKWPS